MKPVYFVLLPNTGIVSEHTTVCMTHHNLTQAVQQHGHIRANGWIKF